MRAQASGAIWYTCAPTSHKNCEIANLHYLTLVELVVRLAPMRMRRSLSWASTSPPGSMENASRRLKHRALTDNSLLIMQLQRANQFLGAQVRSRPK